MSDYVSDDRLNYFISEITDDALMGTSNSKEVMHLLLELKSRRAQQAEPPAGCAEMASEIQQLFEQMRAAYQCDKPAAVYADTRDRISAKLAPLYVAALETEAILRQWKEKQ